MAKYRVLAKFGNELRRDAWDIIEADSAKDAISKGKKKYESGRQFFGKATQWKAIKVKEKPSKPAKKKRARKSKPKQDQLNPRDNLGPLPI